MITTETEITRLPELSPRAETEPIGFYGLRILAYILETGITATLDADQLQLADHMASTAVQSREILPKAVDQISAVRHQIKRALLVIRMRAHEAEILEALTAETDPQSSPEAETDPGAQLDQLSKAEQAVKLLRASLSLIVDDQSSDEDPRGGSRVPVHPKPSSPAPGSSVPIPGARRVPRTDLF